MSARKDRSNSRNQMNERMKKVVCPVTREKFEDERYGISVNMTREVMAKMALGRTY